MATIDAQAEAKSEQAQEEVNFADYCVEQNKHWTIPVQLEMYRHRRSSQKARGTLGNLFSTDTIPVDVPLMAHSRPWYD